MTEMTAFKFISPSGEVVKGKNLKKFCDEHKLGYWPMYRLLRGEYASNNGWFAFHKKSKEVLAKANQVLHNINTGEKAVLGHSITKFAAEHNMHHSVLGQLLNGQRVAYKGWISDATYNLIYGQTSIKKFDYISN